MADYTAHYGLKKLTQGDSLADDSYKFTDADRDIIDLLSWLGAEGHQHTGGASSSVAPTEALNVQLVTTSGTLSAGRRIYYKFTYVDALGAETAGSPEVFLDTPAQIVVPAKPTLASATTGGTLAPGNYYYVLSAYSGTSTFETPGENPEIITIPNTTATNTITVTFPTLPSGATGFNIYRQAPSGPGYFFITSVAVTGGTPTTWVDTGAQLPNCDRTRPTVNTTRQTNSVILTLPGVAPELEVGQSWRIYRTMTSGQWSNSLLATVTPDISYTDTGTATSLGQPPVAGVAIGTPARIQLTNATEVQGRLPLSSMSAFPETVVFALEGDVFPLVGTSAWVCEYPQATILGVRAALGRGYTPAEDDIIVDVNVGSGATPTMSSIFTDEADQPRVLVDEQIGARVAPTAVTELVLGDVLTVDVDQAGGGDPATDRDLIINIHLMAYGWTSSTSHVWAP
jgi:hypothetical protein